jgi:hypothetical protein
MRNCALKSDTHYTVVTILNYELYQGSGKAEGTTQGTGKGQPRDTNKNDKNEKNNNGRPKKETDPRVREFLSYWGETFLQETGQPYPFSYGKDGRLVKDLLKLYSLETLQGITKAFFRDEWCKGKGFDFGLFRMQAGRFLSLKGTNPLEQAKRELRSRS